MADKKDPEKAAALGRAQTKVSDPTFDPSKSAHHSKVVDVPTVDAMRTPMTQSDKAFTQAQQHADTAQQPKQSPQPTVQQEAPALTR